eukprot:435220-Alexandrium_andersonii.AAC.1
MGRARPSSGRCPILWRCRSRHLAHPGAGSAQLRRHSGVSSGFPLGHSLKCRPGGRPPAGSRP